MSRRLRFSTTSMVWNSIKRTKFYVLRIESGESKVFNSYLKSELKSTYGYKLSTGTLSITDIASDDKFIRQFVNKWMPSIGLDGVVLPGYYLFRDGDLVAFHPGTFDAGEIDYGEEERALKVGLGLGLLSAIFSQNLSRGLDTALKSMDRPQGRRIFDFFKSILDGVYSQSQQRRQEKQRKVLDDELSRSYKLLACSLEQSDSEIKQAWRKLLQKHHPDKNFGSQKSGQKTAEINEAYELIKKSRE